MGFSEKQEGWARFLNCGTAATRLAGGKDKVVKDIKVEHDIKIKKNINEVYIKYNRAMDDYKFEKVAGVGLVVTMIVFLLFFLGLKNTIKE